MHVHGTLIYSIRSWKVLLWKNWWVWACFRAISNAYRNKTCPAHNRSTLWQLLHSTKKDLKQCKAQHSNIELRNPYRNVFPHSDYIFLGTNHYKAILQYKLLSLTFPKNLEKKFSTRPRLGSSVDHFLESWGNENWEMIHSLFWRIEGIEREMTILTFLWNVAARWKMCLREFWILFPEFWFGQKEEFAWHYIHVLEQMDK